MKRILVFMLVAIAIMAMSCSPDSTYYQLKYNQGSKIRYDYVLKHIQSGDTIITSGISSDIPEIDTSVVFLHMKWHQSNKTVFSYRK